MILDKTTVWEMRKEIGQKLNKNKDCRQIPNAWHAYNSKYKIMVKIDITKFTILTILDI